MESRNCLILTQYREGDQYNDFIGKYYHFPATAKKNYLNQFASLPIEFVYYEPDKHGRGVFYGYGKIIKPPFLDKTNPDHYFVEISEYKPFSVPVGFKNADEQILEKIYNTPFYNYNNAVRKIIPGFLDNLCLDGGIILNFEADAHLIQVLGEQLIASERVGILELIKNGFDAGASYCKVSVRNIPNLPILDAEFAYSQLPGPIIIIEDDGKGMDKNVIERGWLRPASRIKTNVKEEIRKQRESALLNGNIGVFNSWLNAYKNANQGRLPLGEKGVGRFATHRLGRFLRLITKTAENDFEYVLQINWDDFDNKSGVQVDLHSVGIKLTKQAVSRDYGTRNSGTQLIIYGGRTGFFINKSNIQDIYDSVLSLNSPFTNPFTKQEKDVTPFTVYFDCPQLQAELKNESIYDLAPPVFTFDALVNEDGIMYYDLLFDPPLGVPYSKQKTSSSFDLRLSHGQVFKLTKDEFRKPESGPFYIHVDVWYRTSPWIATQNVKRASELLDNYGGIALYRDFVNLFPADWGANNDWLQLSKRHIQKGSNISYYNMNGYVEVFQESNINLIDKTDRQGLLENQAFKELSLLVKGIVENFIEKEFQARRDDFTSLKENVIRDPERVVNLTTDSTNLVSGILRNYDAFKKPLSLVPSFGGSDKEKEAKLIGLQASLSNLEKSVKQIRIIEEKLVENAGFGLSAAIAIHELAKIVGNFYNGINQMISADHLDKSKLEDLRDSASSLRSELKNLSPLRSIKNEPDRSFNINRAIKYAAEFYKRTFDSLGIEFVFIEEQGFEISAKFGTLGQIFTNLIDNSCYWLDMDTANNRKKIVIKADSERKIVIVADNGPDIDDSILPYLYQAGSSLKSPPSGLGLYICQYYMNRMKGQIGLINQKDRLENMKGAQFILDFSRVKSE
jgi:signal transduction histidine kinase